MKKYLFLVLTLASALFISACGDTNGQEGQKNKQETNKVLAEEDFAKMYTKPKDYKGYELTFTGKVFTTPEKDEDGIYLQVYADPANNEYNTLVAYANPTFDVQADEYITVKGTVKDEFKGENALGGTIIAPMIVASTIEKVDYITAVAPTLDTLEINQEIDQHGLKINLEKIEFAKTHTRVYLTATNDSSDSVSLFQYSAKLIVGNKQYEQESIYEADYPELQSDILVGVESEGIMTFPALDPTTTSLQFILEGSSDNWEIDFDPFTFKVE